MRRFYLLPVATLALTACGGPQGTTSPSQPVETHTPNYYDPTGTWIAVVHDRNGVLDTTYTYKFSVTKENTYDNNSFYSYRYYDGEKAVDTKTSIAHGNTKDGTMTIVSRIGGGDFKGTFDTAKNTYYGDYLGSVVSGTKKYLVMSRQ